MNYPRKPRGRKLMLNVAKENYERRTAIIHESLFSEKGKQKGAHHIKIEQANEQVRLYNNLLNAINEYFDGKMQEE